ncbi:MAG: hypothetical protein ACLQG3_12030 [Terracidiphilus sp.]
MALNEPAVAGAKTTRMAQAEVKESTLDATGEVNMKIPGEEFP